MIVDSHTHAFPAAAVQNPGSWARRFGESHWQRLVAPGDLSDSLQGWVTREDFLRKMDEDGIAAAVLLGWYWQNPDTCLAHNEEMAQWMRDHPQRFRALAAPHPGGPSASEQVQWAVESGFSGFGEILPTVQNSSLSEKFWHDLANLSTEAGLLFNFHVTESVGRNHPGRVPTPPGELQAFIESHPNLTIILSHWGGGLFLSELNPYIRKRFANVYYDSSASPLLYGFQIFPTACELVGSRKILFGSDFPLRLFPREEDRPGWSLFLERLRNERLKARDQENLFARNAQKLFHI